jgi:alanine dehydrogenase
MNPLFLGEDDIRQLAPMPDVIDALHAGFQAQAKGAAYANPRQRLRMPKAALHLMAGRIPGYFGYKAYTTAARGARFLFFLFQEETTELLAIMEADTLGQIRTGAATGLATRLLAIDGAQEATLFGAGWQAETQLLAMAAVRPLQRVWIVNRSAERRNAFVTKMQPMVKAELVPAASPETAVRSSQIVTTMTASKEPVLKGEWLQPGQHVNAAGGNSLLRREVDDQAILRADCVVVDSIEQCKIEAGEFAGVIETGRRHWEEFSELRDIAGGKPGRRQSTDITVFKSLGIALEDVAIGKLVYEQAIERSLGRRLEF